MLYGGRRSTLAHPPSRLWAWGQRKGQVKAATTAAVPIRPVNTPRPQHVVFAPASMLWKAGRRKLVVSSARSATPAAVSGSAAVHEMGFQISEERLRALAGAHRQ